MFKLDLILYAIWSIIPADPARSLLTRTYAPRAFLAADYSARHAAVEQDRGTNRTWLDDVLGMPFLCQDLARAAGVACEAQRACRSLVRSLSMRYALRVVGL